MSIQSACIQQWFWFKLLANFDFYLCLRINFHTSSFCVLILAASGPYWVLISQKNGSLSGPYLKAWGSLLVLETVSWVYWRLRLHPTLITLKLELNYLTRYEFATINMQLELGLRYLRISNFRDAAQRCCPFLDQSVDREANENSIKRTTSTPAAADPAGCADYLSLAWHVSLRFSSAPLDGKIGHSLGFTSALKYQKEKRQ